jgi:hypothetical protein
MIVVAAVDVERFPVINRAASGTREAVTTPSGTS